MARKTQQRKKKAIDNAIPSQLPQKIQWQGHIFDEEPLNWLVSLLFTDQFLDKGTIHYAVSLLFKPRDAGNFQSYEEMNTEREAFLVSNPQADACRKKALAAVEAGEIQTYTPKKDEWGEIWGIAEPQKVNSCQFLLWAEKSGYAIPQHIMTTVHNLIERAVSQRQREEQRQREYPQITAEDFARKRKDILWALSTGILYLFGKRSRLAGEKESDFIRHDDMGKKIVAYAVAAFKVGNLKFWDYAHDPKQPENILSAKIEPEHLISWAKTLPLEIPMLAATPEGIPVSIPAYITPDMRLMFDAIEKFWNNYDLKTPDLSKAPFKKDVVNWLIGEAKRRGLTNFSKSRAEVMDTIIRCPSSQRGGNST